MVTARSFRLIPTCSWGCAQPITNKQKNTMASKVKPVVNDNEISSPDMETMSPIISDTPLGADTTTGRAPTLLDLMANMRSTSRLGEEGRNYIENMKRIFADAKEGISIKRLNNDKIEAVCVVHDASRYAINLLFDESHTAIDNTPAAMRAYDVKVQAETIDRTINVQQTIVVTKLDYSRVEQMAAFIANFFKVLTDTASSMTVDSLAGAKFTVITNAEMVRNFVAKMSPHAVSARDDIGVLICIEVLTTSPDGKKIPEQRPFLAVTGYTRILDPQNSNQGVKFLPIPTITDVVCSIPNRNLLSMALPVAADAFIVQSLWTQPYKDLAKNKPNLGSLCVVDGKPAPCQTIEHLRAFITNYLCQAFLAIDISEGRARPQGIDALTNIPAKVLDSIANFLKTPHVDWIEKGIQPVIMAFSNYTGYYLDKGTYKDTRCVDYLELATKVSDVRSIAGFLVQPKLENVTFDAIKETYPGETTKSIYRTTTVILNAAVITWMSQALRAAKISVTYDIAPSGNLSIDSLMSMKDAANYQPFASVNQGFGMGYMQGPYGPNIYNNAF